MSLSSTKTILRGMLALSLVAALLTPLPASAQAAPTVGPVTIDGPHTGCGEGYVDEGGDTITVSGPTTGTTVDKAIVREYADGQVIRDLARSGVTIANGNLAGSILLQSLQPTTDEIAVVVTVKDAAGVVSQPAESGRLLVDRVSPTITSVKTTTTTKILVTFSEAVSNPQDDSTLDWYVRGNNTLRPSEIAAPAPNLRELTFQSTSFGVDENFRFDYWQPVTRPRKYVDCVNHDLVGDTRVTALDGIAPPVPDFIDVSGSNASDSNSWSRDTTPEFRIGGLTAGYETILWKETNGTEGLQKDSDSRLDPTVVAEGAQVSMARDTLSVDGGYTYYATSIDINGNPSTGADPVTYNLDRVAPTVGPARTANSTVRVAFSEPLFGSDAVGDWTISSVGNPQHTITGVSGTGAARILATSGVPNGATVTYAPTGARYTDEAGNEIDPFTVEVTEGLIPTAVDLEPEAGTSSVGQDHVLTATVVDDAGVAVPAERVVMRATAGPASTRDADQDSSTPVGQVGSCFTGADGTCTVSYSSTIVEADTIQAWIGTTAPAPEQSDAGDLRQDVVTVDWEVENTDLRLDVSPETSSGPIGQQHQVNVSVSAVEANTNVGGIRVGARVIEGPNLNSMTTGCTTGADGACTISYTSTATGRDSIQTWIDLNKDGNSSGELFLDRNEAQDADASAGLTNDARQDVVFQTWTSAAVPTLQVEPDSVSQATGTNRSFTISLRDGAAGPALGGFNIDALVLSGPNAGRHSQCVTGSGGACSMLAFSSPRTGTDLIRFWVDADGDNSADEATQLEARAEGSPDEPDQDLVQITWTAPGTEPTPAPTPTGGTTPGPTPSPGQTNNPSGDEVNARTIDIETSKNRVGYKRSLVLSGDVVSVPECQVGSVVIERRVMGGRFAGVRTVDVVDQAWSTNLRPSKTAEYRASIDSTETCEGATSGIVKVSVAARVTANVSSRSVDSGSCVSIRGRVLPRKAGQVVRLQRKAGTRWVREATDSLDKRSRYSLKLCLPDGGYRFRVRYGGDALNLADLSPISRVSVGR